MQGTPTADAAATMSHWGRGTGYTYTTERLGFLNDSISTQRRCAMQAAMRPAGFMPLGNRAMLAPLEPLPRPHTPDDMTHSQVLSARARHLSLRRLGQLPVPEMCAAACCPTQPTHPTNQPTLPRPPSPGRRTAPYCTHRGARLEQASMP